MSSAGEGSIHATSTGTQLPETNGPTTAIAATPDLPSQIGPYHILGVIGEGGMGVIYRAEQRRPVRRLVALKVVKLPRIHHVNRRRD